MISVGQFEVFERMHYSCSHYLFEHDPFDPDEECTAGGCPSASIQPGHHREEPRDSLVEELIDDLDADATAQVAVGLGVTAGGALKVVPDTG